MKVTQGTINDFFALTNTIIFYPKNKKTHFMGSITMLSIK